MDPSAIEIALDKGGTFGLLAILVWVLVKKLDEQYRDRIRNLESRSEECENDRHRLHDDIKQLHAKMAEVVIANSLEQHKGGDQ